MTTTVSELIIKNIKKIRFQKEKTNFNCNIHTDSVRHLNTARAVYTYSASPRPNFKPAPPMP